MKMISKKTVLISALAATLGMGTMASYADSHGKGCHGKRGEHSMVKHLQKKLDLSDEQSAQITEISDKQREMMREMRKEKREERKALMSLDPGSDNYDAELDKLAQQAGERAEKMLRARAETQASVAKVLTTEQQEKWKEMRGKKLEKMEKRGERGHGHKKDKDEA